MQYEHSELGLGTWMLWNLKYWVVLHKIGHNNNGLEEQTLDPINLNNWIIKVVNLRVNNLDWAVNFDGRGLVGKEKVYFLNTYSFRTAANILREKIDLEKNIGHFRPDFHMFFLFILLAIHFSPDSQISK